MLYVAYRNTKNDFMNGENVNYDERMSYQNSERQKLYDNTGYSYFLV